jgi:hypothetical protein
LDEEIRISNQHTWKVYLNVKVSHLVSFAFCIAFMVVIKIYETPSPFHGDTGTGKTTDSSSKILGSKDGMQKESTSNE